MAILNKIQDFVKNLSEQDFLKYLLIFCASILVIFALMFYLHYRRVSFYLEELEKIKQERKKTAEILTKNKIVSQQRQKVDEILNEGGGVFRIAEAFEKIIKNLNLDAKRENKEILTTEGSIINDKIEQKLTVKLNKITTKDLTDLLSKIAAVDRLYPKELTINKNSDNQTINIEITIATLEPAPKK